MEEKRGRGRPKKNEEELTNKFVTLRLTKYEKEWLEKIAKDRKVGISKFIRMLLNEEIEAVKKYV